MHTIEGPGLFLAQFARDEAPQNSLDSMLTGADRATTRRLLGVQD